MTDLANVAGQNGSMAVLNSIQARQKFSVLKNRKIDGGIENDRTESHGGCGQPPEYGETWTLDERFKGANNQRHQQISRAPHLP